MRLGNASTSKLKTQIPGPAPALRSFFPSVRELRIELAFDAEYGWEPSKQVHILHPPSRASFRYPCPFAGCSGSFDLDASIRALLQASRPGVRATLDCTGVRPFDRSTGKLCGARLHYQVSVICN